MNINRILSVLLRASLIGLLVWYAFSFVEFFSFTSKVVGGVGDELLALWIFKSFSNNLFTHSRHLLDGGIFFPNQNTLVFAELMPLPGLVFGVLNTFLGNLILGFNFLVAIALATNFYCMYLFSCLWLKRASAFIAAMIFAFSMVRIAQLSHVQLMFQCFYPLTGYFLWKFYQSEKASFLYLSGLCVVLQYFSCIYLGMMLMLALIPIAITYAYQQPKQIKKQLLHIVGASVFCASLLLPLAYQYYRVSHEHQMVRKIEEAQIYSGYLHNFFYAPPGSLWHVITQWIEWGGQLHEKYYFLGGVSLGLIVFGVKCLLKSNRDTIRKSFSYLFPSILLCLLLFLGPSFGVYHLFYDFFPGFQSLRVPARFGLVLLFWAALFAGWAFERIRVRESKKNILFIGLVVLFLIENYTPKDFVSLPIDQNDVNLFLAEEKEKGVVFYYPMEDNEPLRMYYSLQHGHRLFNGYSGFTPQPQLKLLLKMRQERLSNGVIDELLKIGVNWLVMENDNENFQALDKLTRVFEGEYYGVYKLNP